MVRVPFIGKDGTVTLVEYSNSNLRLKMDKSGNSHSAAPITLLPGYGELAFPNQEPVQKPEIQYKPRIWIKGNANAPMPN